MELQKRELEWNEFLKNLKRGFAGKPYGIRLFDQTQNPCHEIPFTAITPITVCTEEIKIWDLSGMEVMDHFAAKDAIGFHGEAVLEYHGTYGSKKFSIRPVVTLSTGGVDPSLNTRKTHTLWQFYAMTGVDLRDTWSVPKPVVFDNGLEAAEWLAAFWEEVADDIDGRLAGWAIQGGHVESVEPAEAINAFCQKVIVQKPGITSSYRLEAKDRYEIVLSYPRRFFREDAHVEISFLLERKPLQQFANAPYWQINPRRAEVHSPDGMKGDCMCKNIPVHMKTMFLLKTIDSMVNSVLVHIDECDVELTKKNEEYEVACVADDIAEREAALTGSPRWPNHVDFGKV